MAVNLMATRHCSECEVETTGNLFCKNCGASVVIGEQSQRAMRHFLDVYTVTSTQKNYYESCETLPENNNYYASCEGLENEPASAQNNYYESCEDVQPSPRTSYYEDCTPSDQELTANFLSSSGRDHSLPAAVGYGQNVSRQGSENADMLRTCHCGHVTNKTFCTMCGARDLVQQTMATPPRHQQDPEQTCCATCGGMHEPFSVCTLGPSTDSDPREEHDVAESTSLYVGMRDSHESPSHDVFPDAENHEEHANRLCLGMSLLTDFFFEVREQRQPKVYGKRLPYRRLFLIIACGCLGARLFKTYMYDSHTDPKAKFQKFVAGFDQNLTWPHNGTAFDNLFASFGEATKASDDVSLIAWGFLAVAIFIESLSNPRVVPYLLVAWYLV